MREITDRSPVLILPHEDLKRSRVEAHDRSEVHRIARESVESPDSFRPGSWTLLSSLYSGLIRQFMMNPYDPAVLDALKSAAVEIPPQGDTNSSEEVAALRAHKGWVEISAENPRHLISSISRDSAPPRLRVFFDSSSGAYRVFWNRSPEQTDGIADIIEHGAWILTTLHGAETGVRRILGDRELVDSVLDGARILYIPQGAAITFPRLVPLARAREGGGIGIHEFWTPDLGQVAGRGDPPISYIVNQNLHERLSVQGLISAIEKKITEARAMGKTPAVACDLDGTVLWARRFAAEIFSEWLRSYDGPDADEIREKARGSKVMQGWNSLTILKDLGIERQQTLEDADKYFKANFYNPVRRLEMPPIRGMVEFVQLLMKMGVKMVYVTLRSVDEDTLPDKSSSSERVLRKLGIFDERSVLLRHDGEKIDWSAEAYHRGGNEPDKWRMVKAYRKANANYYFIGVLENAPAHIRGYREFFEYSVINMHVMGDNPPDSPTLPDAVFMIDPDKLAIDLRAWQEGGRRKGSAFGSDVVQQFQRILSAQYSPFYLDYPERHEQEIRTAAVQASRTIDAVAGISPLNEINRAFIEKINETYTAQPGKLEEFEEMVARVNMIADTSYAVVRGPAGVERVVHAKRGRLPDDVRPRPVPKGFDSSKLSTKRALSMEELEARLQDMMFGPDLTEVLVGDRYDALSFARYPRMIEAFRSAMAYVSREFKKSLDKIRVLEFGPRLAIGGLITMARFGANVNWLERSDLKRIQTKLELERLPRVLQERINYKPPKDHGKADIAVWNLPHLNTPLSRMSRHVKRNGILIVQSQKSAEEYKKESNSNRLMAEVTLPAGQYVMPTAFLHVVPIFNMPLHFQVWKVR